MAKDQQEGTHYELIETPDVTERALVLWVPRFNLDADAVTALGTTLANFLPNVIKGNAIANGFGAYILTNHYGSSGDYVGFTFGKPKTAGQMETAFRTTYNIEPSVSWPAVLRSLSWTPINRIDPDTGTQFVERYNWEADIRASYDGPTKVKIEEFLDPTQFAIAVPEIMRPDGFVFDYVLGEFTLPPCLHSAFTLNFSTGTSNVHYPYIVSAKTILATNYTDWPSTIVVSDTQQQLASGLWLRKTVTAYKPSVL